ncbi:hypothetical protein [Actinoplanes sp. NPDC023714]|uniref:hypothetical protein n=1 Tax=Actinoplanes sp. NPDC023714 TaxID=3154322 RepID=UPI00340ECEF3
MTIPVGTRRRMSNHVAKNASLIDVRLHDISARLLGTVGKTPLRPSIKVDANFGRAQAFALYDYTYELEATDDSGKSVFRAAFALNLVFRLTDSESVTAEELEAFGSFGVAEIAHPYVRELIHNLTFRMGLPPFILEVAPPIVDQATVAG